MLVLIRSALAVQERDEVAITAGGTGKRTLVHSLNDYGTESLTALLYAVERLRSVVRAQDAAGFAALMERGREYLSFVGRRDPPSQSFGGSAEARGAEAEGRRRDQQ